MKLCGPGYFFGRIGCQPKGSKVLMADGEWKNIEKIEVGDEILSPQKNGEYIFGKIVKTYKWKSKKNYDVFQLNRQKLKLYSCSSNHEIPVWHNFERRKTWEIKEITAENLSNQTKSKKGSQDIAFSCPPIKEFRDRINCMIEPYSLGIFLGDGMFTESKQGKYTRRMVNITTMDFEVIEEISKYYSIINIYQQKNNKSKTFSFSVKSDFAKYLSLYGLNGKKSGEKFIPREALLSSINYRKKLLAGLIDSDGYLSRENSYSITTKSEKLAEDILFLIYSLGGRGRISKEKKSIKKLNFTGEYFRVSFFIHKMELPIKVKRRIKPKKSCYIDSNRIAIEVKPSQDNIYVYGFTVDTPSHYYITDNFMVTKNSGKTWKMIAMAQVYHSKLNYKIFDIYGGRYCEEGYWCFPSDEKKLWWEFRNEVGVMKSEGPKEYNVNLLFPCFAMKLPKEIPEHLPRIKSQIFTIPFKTITEEDISVVIGELSKNSVYFWNKIRKDLPKNATAGDIDNYVDKHLPKFKKLAIYRNFLKPALDNYLISGDDCPLALDLIKEAKEQERISILCHLYMPNMVWQMFIMNYITRRILFDLIPKEKIPKDNIAIFREAGDFMKIIDKDKDTAEQVQTFRNKLNKLVRYSRRGLIPFMDTQSPSDTKGLIEGQEDLLCINEISIIDIGDILEKLKKEKRISATIKNRLSTLNQKELIIVERKQKAVLLKRFMPPRCMCYKGKSFLKIWKERINDWKKTRIDIKIVEEEFYNAKEKQRIKNNEEMILEESLKSKPKTKPKPTKKEIEEVLEKLEEEPLII